MYQCFMFLGNVNNMLYVKKKLNKERLNKKNRIHFCNLQEHFVVWLSEGALHICIEHAWYSFTSKRMHRSVLAALPDNVLT